MEQLQLPKTFRFVKEQGNESVFVLEPCYPGYGVTIGSAIRRVLLSSLNGAAVTAVTIKGVDHEFSTIPSVKEDVVEIILNLKKLCLKSFSESPVKLKLKVKGDKEVTAGMFEKNDQVEIANPELHIATLDGKNAELEMELTIEQGRGYVPVEAREEEKQEIGVIAVDAIYTPIRNVNFTTELMRVGKMTNYERLTLTIVTNGTITGREALDQAARIILDHFNLLTKDKFESEESESAKFINHASKSPEVVETEAEMNDEETAPLSDSLLSLGLSRRAYNALAKNKITSAEQLKNLTEADLNNMQGLGEKSIAEILEVIKSL